MITCHVVHAASPCTHIVSDQYVSSVIAPCLGLGSSNIFHVVLIMMGLIVAASQELVWLMGIVSLHLAR